MMHIGLIDLGFAPEGIDLLTGNASAFEVEFESSEAFEALNESEQARIILMQCLPLEIKSGDVSDQEHATAETETSTKETININSTATFNSDKLARWQVQMLANTVSYLDPSQSVSYLFQEIDAWRGTKTLDKLCDDLVNVLRNVLAEINADDPEEQPAEHPRQPFNARTTDRLTFTPIRDVSISDKRVSWPAKSYVQVVMTAAGTFDLFAWVDVPTSGPADYVRRYVGTAEFVMED